MDAKKAAGACSGSGMRVRWADGFVSSFVQWDGGGWEWTSAVAALVPAEAAWPVLVMTRCTRVRAVWVSNRQGTSLGT